MKRLMCLVLCLVTSWISAGCTDQSPDPPAETGGATTGEDSAKPQGGQDNNLDGSGERGSDDRSAP